ncbi:hypothetical protein GWK47_008343 [Chionoecetes opilio]|uniref:Uncharacterized protein n=1 Tax=Chionoecetes opilio TaxID=41210 RepID=A0A8J4Y593_CHIOP|nr:hypothetical protein GWK47_008343 [Chionoecetes opilio]
MGKCTQRFIREENLGKWAEGAIWERDLLPLYQRTQCQPEKPAFKVVRFYDLGDNDPTDSNDPQPQEPNGIAVQFRVAGSVPEKVLPEITKSKIKHHSDRINSPKYTIFGRRAGPPRIETAYVDTTKEVQDSKTKNHIWLLTRMSDHENQSQQLDWVQHQNPQRHCSGPGH